MENPPFCLMKTRPVILGGGSWRPQPGPSPWSRPGSTPKAAYFRVRSWEYHGEIYIYIRVYIYITRIYIYIEFRSSTIIHIYMIIYIYLYVYSGM